MVVSIEKGNTIFNFLLFMACSLFLSECRAKISPDRSESGTRVTADTIPIAICSDSLLKCPVDSICVIKHKRTMYVFNQKKLLKVYRVCLGTSPVGPKRFEGDRKTPEGLYYINGKNPHSMAHKNLGVSYPNDNDRKYARRMGRSTGGSIKIHGMVNGYEDQEAEYLDTDWTWGCIAVRNKDIDELYEYVPVGVPINISP